MTNKLEEIADRIVMGSDVVTEQIANGFVVGSIYVAAKVISAFYQAKDFYHRVIRKKEPSD